MFSAFGVDHGGEFAKADDKYGGHGAPSGGRRALAYYGGPIHPAVAGKKGKKLRATGNTYGGAVGGAVGGQVAGGVAGAGLRVATRGRAGGPLAGKAIGGITGGVTGSQLGVNRNQRKGYYKPERKT